MNRGFTTPRKECPLDWTLNGAHDLCEAKPILISRMTGKIKTQMECLVEFPNGVREYMTGREFDNLTK